jgi:lipid-A-disaccharide synthase
MKYYIIAGERSGDLHGSNLIKAIRKHDTEAEIRAWGGDLMQATGATIVTHYADMAFMGFWEVIKNIGTITGFLKKCKSDIIDYQPDVLILIDYAGFNMRMARFAKEHNFKTFYYISPKVWAWNQKRALKIKKYIDQLYVIFPFEVSFFKKYNYQAHYVGNPLLDAIADFKPNPNFLSVNRLNNKPIVALLPGSRRQEVEQMLSVMLSLQNQFTDYQFVVAGVRNLPQSLYDKLLNNTDTKIVFDSAYDLLSVATAALVTSGTATLETALFNVPQVVCYKGSWLSFQIAKLLIRVPYISLVNLITDNEAVKELIQDQLNTQNLTTELQKIVLNGSERAKQLADYAFLQTKMGEVGASERAGGLMVEYLRHHLSQNI